MFHLFYVTFVTINLKFLISIFFKFNTSCYLYVVSFRPETPFLGKFGPKNQNCQFKLKFGSKTYLKMQNLMAMFTFSVLNRKHPFRANLVQKIKIASLR